MKKKSSKKMLGPTLTTTELVEHICKRPRMFCGEIQTTREMIAFLSGVCCSAQHLHGHDLGGFSEYLATRFHKPPVRPWPSVLLEEFGSKPYAEGRDAVLAVVQEWLASKPTRG